MEYAADHMTNEELREQIRFNDWMELVDQAIDKVCGLESGDLPDVDYHSKFDSGTSPADMTRIALENAGYPFEDKEAQDEWFPEQLVPQK